MSLLAGVTGDMTVFGRFQRTAERFADRPFLTILPETAGVYGIAAGTTTYGEALSAVLRQVAAYRAADYGAGHRVGLLLQNRPDFIIHWFALNALGVSVVPINPDLRAAELEYLIAHSGLVLAVSTADRIRDLTEAAAASGAVLGVITPDETVPAAPILSSSVESQLSRDDECALLYTSGTTGKPKGCVLTNDYFLTAGEWYATVGGLASLRVDPPERMLTPLPLFHMNAMAYSLIAVITVAGSIAILDRFHPRSWWASLRSFGATVVHYLGVMPAMLMSATADPSDREHDVRFGFGAGVDRSLHGAFEERFGFPLLEAWAMTETGAGAVVIASREPRQIGTNCFGQPQAEVEITIRSDTGAEAATDEPGELLVRRAGSDPRRGFFREYLGDPEATNAAWEGGWFHTGDVVRRDADGQLHFVDRRKNVIRRSGENISAVEVESVLALHHSVGSVAVAPTLDAVRGEEVVALIVPREGAAAGPELAEEIVRYCLSRLAYYKAPGHVAFVDAIPLTSTEKIQRGALKTTVESVISNGTAIDTRSLKKRTA